MLDRWRALVARVTETPGQDRAPAVFDDLYTRYTAADRRCHDIYHIDDCLQLLDTVRALASKPDAIEPQLTISAPPSNQPPVRT
jgi:predicted metal-dependent HD superfamily phosphohydrolase